MSGVKITALIIASAVSTTAAAWAWVAKHFAITPIK
jgi:hypothetical protein